MSSSLERRQSRRYSIDLAAQSKVRKNNKFVDAGDGKIHNVSRAGMFLECAEAIPAGTAVRLVVEWPVQFEGKTRVEWIVDGLVVRSDSSGMAVNIIRQRFERVSQGRRKKMAN